METTTPPMLVHLAARSSLALLRQPQVTMALFYAIKFKPLDRKSLFVETRTGYEPTPLAVTLRWLNEAANGGATYERFVEQGDRASPAAALAKRLSAPSKPGCSATAAASKCWSRMLGPGPRLAQAGPKLGLGIPSRVEYLTTPDLMDTQVRPAKIVQGEATARIQLPAWSLTRIEWNRR